MKLVLKGIITEVGSNYESNDTPHSGMIVQCNGQNLHFQLSPEQTRDMAYQLFKRIKITITLEKPKK